jgi:DNA topoisomerase-3
VVNAGDADREGEIIIRTCVTKLLNRKISLKRLWLPDQTPETVSAALDSMNDESEYDLLASEGYARTFIDWLYGVNLTRYATIRCGKLLRVGRVIVPIVRAIYDRDMEIRNFKPEKYFVIQSSAKTGGEKIELTGKQKFSADKLADIYNLSGVKATASSSVSEAVSKAVASAKESQLPIFALGSLYMYSEVKNAVIKAK